MGKRSQLCAYVSLIIRLVEDKLKITCVLAFQVEIIQKENISLAFLSLLFINPKLKFVFADSQYKMLLWEQRRIFFWVLLKIKMIKKLQTTANDAQEKRKIKCFTSHNFSTTEMKYHAASNRTARIILIFRSFSFPDGFFH